VVVHGPHLHGPHGRHGVVVGVEFVELGHAVPFPRGLCEAGDMDKARPAPTLAGWYVISLRPSGSHAPVRRAATALGARTLSISTLALRPQPAGPALQAALACPLVIVTSPAAVQFARRQLPLVAAPDQRWLALGEA